VKDDRTDRRVGGRLGVEGRSGSGGDALSGVARGRGNQPEEACSRRLRSRGGGGDATGGIAAAGGGGCKGTPSIAPFFEPTFKLLKALTEEELTTSGGGLDLGSSENESGREGAPHERPFGAALVDVCTGAPCENDDGFDDKPCSTCFGAIFSSFGDGGAVEKEPCFEGALFENDGVLVSLRRVGPSSDPSCTSLENEVFFVNRCSAGSSSAPNEVVAFGAALMEFLRRRPFISSVTARKHKF
jgi:hypothetical protein